MKLTVKFGTAICLLLFLMFSIAAQNKPVSIVSTKEDLLESVNSVPCKNEERLEAIKSLFQKMGAKPEEITVEKLNKDKISNVIVTKKGKTDETIIIGAHYDKVSEGCGAVDNWTGISIIAHIYKTFSKIETNKTLLIVAFDQEEKGLLGSEAMAKEIPKEKRTQYCSMVNFDSFGFSPPFVLQNTSTSKLQESARKFAKENDFKMANVEITGADADSSSFKSRDIPAITFSGLDGNWQKILHSSNDKLDKINIDSVYFGYRFGLAFLAKLDSDVCREPKK
jgi:Zn-dependent M28 family amino/carboxypeptidase